MVTAPCPSFLVALGHKIEPPNAIIHSRVVFNSLDKKLPASMDGSFLDKLISPQSSRLV